MSELTYACPHCGKKIPVKQLASHLGQIGGAKGGASTSEAKRAAARANLEKARAARVKS